MDEEILELQCKDEGAIGMFSDCCFTIITLI